MGTDATAAVDFEDYYDLLGVDPDADREAIVRAYKRAVKTYHPDRREAADLDSDTAAAVFSHLSAARSILTNPARRAAYDRLGHRAYVLEHGDGEEDPLRPVSEPRETAEVACDHDDAWYAATTPVPGETDPEDGVATGEVVEGEDVGLSDLLGRDPLETAWRRFLAVWGLRLVVFSGLAAASLVALGPGAAVAMALVVVVLSGSLGSRLTPVTADPTTPPRSASVGILRPSTAGRLRRIGRRSLGVAVVALAVATVVVPRPVATAGPTLPTRWLASGTLGAPKLQSLLADGLTLALGTALVVGVVGVVGGVSAGAWLSRHGRHRRTRTWLWDLASVAGSLCVLLGVVTTPPFPVGVPAAVWDAGVVYVTAGAGALIALTVVADRRLSGSHSEHRTSATTA